MEIKTDISIPLEVCPHCFGSGKLKVMQSMAVIGGASIRGEDTKVKCNRCKGIGVINKR